MVDPAVIDLLHHLSTASVVIDRPAARGVGAGGRGDVESGEPYIRAIETRVAAWLRSTDAKFGALIRAYGEAEADERTLRYPDQLIESLEAHVSDSARLFRRNTKTARRAVKYRKSLSVRDDAIAGMQGDRALKAMAEMGEKKQEMLFALRVLRAELNGKARTGPVFSDPDAMMAYLRAAVA